MGLLDRLGGIRDLFSLDKDAIHIWEGKLGAEFGKIAAERHRQGICDICGNGVSGGDLLHRSCFQITKEFGKRWGYYD